MTKEKQIEKLTRDIWEAGGSDLMVSDMNEIRQIAEGLIEQSYRKQNSYSETTITAKVRIELTKNDIFNWLNDCNDPEALRYLGRAALRFAAAIENPDDDDFHSRA